jgi:hypothetical protein
MKTVLPYDQWVIQESKKLAGTPLEMVSSIKATQQLVEALVKKPGFSDDEKMFFYLVKESNMSIIEWQEAMLTEGFLDKLKDWGSSALDKTKEVITDVKDWAGAQIEGIPDFLKAVAGGVKNLGTMIVEFFTKVFGTIFKAPVDYAKKALGSGYAEIEKKTKEAVDKEAAKVKEEVPGFAQIVKGTPKALSSKGLGEAFSKAMVKADSEKVEDSDLAIVKESINTSLIIALTEAVNLHTAEEIKEGISLINTLDTSAEAMLESGDHGAHGHTEIPFVSTVSGFLEKLPPFSWLGKLAEYLGEKSNEFLTMLSTAYKQVGAVKEVVKFTVLGSLVGLGLEYLVKSSTKSALVHFFPPLHTALVTLGGIATGICIVHVASTVIDGLKDHVEEIDAAAKAAH